MSILFDSAAMTMNKKQAAPVNTAQGITAAAMLFKHERTRGGRRGEDNPTIRSGHVEEGEDRLLWITWRTVSPGCMSVNTSTS